jgi:hypothetical protein
MTMEAQLDAFVRSQIPTRLNLREETINSLAAAGAALLLQIRSDLDRCASGDRIQDSDLLHILKVRHLEVLRRPILADIKRAISEAKPQKILKLQEAGYGAGAEHFSFIENMLASEHQVLVPDPTIIWSDDEPD